MFESFGYSIAEAMMMGYRPLINDFPGADELWPSDCLFSDIDDLIRMVQDDNYHSERYREYVNKRYSPKIQINHIENMICEMI
ncbi:hypothetical protein DSCOOX_15310 [Desulfosarcina ovata subsp. ovata]|uniref:Glycosyl transferase family 1 domain-containing protein n=1 Tax=Desulfosarcina ovata subsp. ovata TaxID=2752305 RepID=A0A5K8A7A3_9BACT|nr:hypothetical protein DSCOOX_15310 [Desulfosarcina ovata subsp. ovata]